MLEPSTQAVDADLTDTEEDAAERLGPPVRCRGLWCNDASCKPALDTADGGFFCEECVVDEVNESEVVREAEAQLAARVAAAAQLPPRPPVFEPQRSGRTITPIIPVYDLERGGKGQPGCSQYDIARLGSRHDRTRTETYAEVCTARHQLRETQATARRKCSELAARLDALYERLRQLTLGEVSDLSQEDCQMAAAVILGEAVTEI